MQQTFFKNDANIDVEIQSLYYSYKASALDCKQGLLEFFKYRFVPNHFFLL